MAGQTDHTDIVGEVLAAELCAKAEFLRSFLEFLLQFYVAESMAVLVALCRQGVQIFHRSLLHHFEILLGRSAADHESDMVWRTCSRAECAHLVNKEGHQGLGIDCSLGFLVEVGLVGAAATLGYEKEVVFVALAGVDIDLCGQVAACVHLVVHVQRRVLAVAEIVGGVGKIHTLRNLFGIVAAGEHQLAFLGMADGCACVLAERQCALGGHFGIAQHGKGHIAVVVARFGVLKYFRNHHIVLATQHEGIVVCGLAGKHGEGFRFHDKELMPTPGLGAHIVGSQMVIFCSVGSQGKHFLVVKRFCCHRVGLELLANVRFLNHTTKYFFARVLQENGICVILAPDTKLRLSGGVLLTLKHIT